MDRAYLYTTIFFYIIQYELLSVCRLGCFCCWLCLICIFLIIEEVIVEIIVEVIIKIIN